MEDRFMKSKWYDFFIWHQHRQKGQDIIEYTVILAIFAAVGWGLLDIFNYPSVSAMTRGIFHAARSVTIEKANLDSKVLYPDEQG
jgi:hypothetical protein